MPAASAERKTRVLHIIPNFGPGGAERLVVDLMEATDRDRFKVAAVSLYPESGTILEQEIRRKGLKVHFLGKHRGLDLRMIPRLCRVMRCFRPDVVHTHRYVLRYALLPALLCRVPVRVHTVHNVAEKEVDGIGKLVHWLAFRLGGVVPVSISQEVARTVRKNYGRAVGTPVIYNGIPTARFARPARERTAGARGLVLLHIGRFAPQKNHRLLVEGCALASREYPSMQLWLVGEGPLRAEVERLVREKGLEERVLFLGVRSDVPELLAAADIFVLPSDWEGLPLVVVEAMAAGKPVIASAVGGVPELIEQERTGMLVPAGDPEALAQAILRLARDPELRRRVGEAARASAVERFDIGRTAREYGELYLRLLEEAKAR